jgi:hypothetical protein
MGHSVVSFYPTDKPAGPSTKLYVGRLVYTIDNAGNAAVQSFSGHTTDLCKKLA